MAGGAPYPVWAPPPQAELSRALRGVTKSQAETGVPSAAETGTPTPVCLSESFLQLKPSQTSRLEPHRGHRERGPLENYLVPCSVCGEEVIVAGGRGCFPRAPSQCSASVNVVRAGSFTQTALWHNGDLKVFARGTWPGGWGPVWP